MIHLILATLGTLLRTKAEQKFSFFTWTIIEWNKLDLQICKSTYHVFSNYLLKCIRPFAAPIYNICNSLGLIFIYYNKDWSQSSQ